MYYFIPLQGQQIYKFPILHEGVYQLSQGQATDWGLGNLDQIRILGHPGMLDQKIDSSLFAQEEIPQLKIADKLYFFLEGPDQVYFDKGKAKIKEHHYTDTLYYLLQTGNPSTRKVTQVGDAIEIEEGLYSPKPLYQISLHKEEEDNILSSGRNWYGYRTFNSGSHIISIAQPSANSEGPVTIWAQLMAQSFSESKFTFAANNQVLGEASIPSIPDSRYAIKGREVSFDANFPKPQGNKPQDIVLTYSSNHPNGTGYVKNILLGYPFSSSLLPEGVYYNPDDKPYPLQTTFSGLWDVSDFYQVKDLKTSNAQVIDSRKIVVFNPENTPEIASPEKVKERQNLLSGQPEFIIITSELLYGQAKRLSEFKNALGLSTEVVLTNAIYDSYGYGNPDITSIRNFLADYWQTSGILKNVLFFGKGSFDYKHKLGGRPNLVPTYSSRVSLNPLTTYGSDDYFGFLEIGNGDWLESPEGDHILQIGIGRIPAINAREAKIAVDKIITYQTGNDGNWKRNLLFVADDGDNNIHLKDSEKHTAYLHDQSPAFKLKKLYLDDFPQEMTANLQTVIKAKEAFITEIKEGLLLLNYIGHGNELNLTAEGLFTVSDIEDWPITNRFPVMVTATCEFGRHDSPFIRSGAEELLLAEQKGVIAMLTTGRPVFSSINYALNKAFIEAAFKQGEGLSLGEIFKKTKNNSLNGPLNRNFSLLGDPSLKLDLPLYEATAKEWMEVNTQFNIDSLSGLNRLEYNGKVEDPLTSANVTQFDGTYEISIIAPPKQKETLGDESPETSYTDYNQPLFHGIGTVNKGLFTGEVLLPELDDYSEGELQVSLFASHNDLSMEAFGATKIVAKQKHADILQEDIGPGIEVWIADSLLSKPIISFKNTPIWVELSDDSGISTQHPMDISLQVNDAKILSLTSEYTAVNGSYKSGRINAWVNGLKEGTNKLIFSATDQLGNTTHHIENVEVIGSNQLKIENLLVYPNPSIDQFNFKIAHNRPGETLNLNLSIFSLQGTEIFSYQGRFPKAERSILDIQWIFLNSKSKNLIKGTYLYNLNLYSEEDATSDVLAGKIIIQ
ncbi:type IX secretion system sortase PorU [uncultured Cyclobacterium sp.]|uniref:type IX secretion system sortase PorU n=1 Tax=uncultured Cyclobacterium sp. TaxID=453820 RepID=UPI0030EE7014|tara:strand:+ start:102529 stop:105735 length:3207 start_codon:yes stop_codon:yes gene_type:complete